MISGKYLSLIVTLPTAPDRRPGAQLLGGREKLLLGWSARERQPTAADSLIFCLHHTDNITQFYYNTPTIVRLGLYT